MLTPEGFVPRYRLARFPEPLRKGVYTFPFAIIKMREDGTHEIVFKCESVKYADEILINLGVTPNESYAEIPLVGN